jgi:hypothetical protein
VIAINVALIFPITPPLKQANEYLKSVQPNGFRFDANHKPHVTLLQDFIKNCPDTVVKLTAALTETLNSFTIPDVLHFSALSIPPGLSPSLLVDDSTEQILSLHTAIIGASQPFSLLLYDDSAPEDAFAQTPSHSGVEYVKHYRTKYSNNHYDPHLTLGKGSSADREGLAALLPLPMHIECNGIVLAQLGPHGTVSDNILARWQHKQ